MRYGDIDHPAVERSEGETLEPRRLECVQYFYSMCNLVFSRTEDAVHRIYLIRVYDELAVETETAGQMGFFN